MQRYIDLQSARKSARKNIATKLVASSSAGLYLLQLTAVYSGMELRNGKFVESADEPIQAFEQSIISVDLK
jgi:hypothetical protein